MPPYLLNAVIEEAHPAEHKAKAGQTSLAGVLQEVDSTFNLH
jgi:hypothetical protein